MSQRCRTTSLPEELFEHILWHLVGGHVFTSLSNAEARHPIATCGCVCRYWASICRPRLFQSLLLRSRQDLEDYSHMLDLPSIRDLMRLPYLTVRLIAKPDGHEEPWLHLFPSSVLGKLPHKSFGVPIFSVDASTLRTKKTLRLNTLHPSIPRTLPTVFTSVTALELVRVHFRDGAELVKLINRLVLLKRMDLVDLTWDTSPDVTAFLTIKAPTLSLVVVTCDRISPLWFLPALLAKTGCELDGRRLRTPECILGDGEYEALLDLLQTSRMNIQMDTSVPVVRDIHHEVTEDNGHVHVMFSADQGRKRLIPMLSLDFRPCLFPAGSTQVNNSITLWACNIRFIWFDSPSPKQWITGELAESVQCARGLAHLESIVHRFEVQAHTAEFVKLYGVELAPVGNTRCIYRAPGEVGQFVKYPLGPSKKVSLMRAGVDYVEFH